MSSATLKMELMKSDIVADSKQQQHFHVLAVDDSLLDRKLLERLLRGSSYKVTCVDSGDEALKYLGLVDDLNQHSIPSSNSSTTSSQSSELEGSKVINLIMTDYCMPGMSGYDLLKRVKESSLKDVPVVVMSSENVPSRINMCLEGGAEEFLLKPLQISDLKKLQPYLLKSQLEHSNCNNNNNNNDNIDNNTNLIVSEVIGDTSIDQNKSSTTTENIKGNINNNISISKRKAVVSPQTSERRPKMEGLAVV